MTLQQLNFIFRIENFLCIYRNTTSFTKFGKIFIFTRIIFELLFMAVNGTQKAINAFHSNKIESVFIVISLINSIFIVISSCYHSKNIRRIVINLNTNNNFFNREDNYLKRLKYNFKILNCLVLSVISLKVGVLNYRRLQIGTSNIVELVSMMNITLCNFRNTFEHLVIYSILCIMSEQLRCVRLSTDEIYTAMKNNKNYQDVFTSDFLATKCEQCIVNFSRIYETSKLFNTVFHLQV